MADFTFPCPHCQQHIQCDEAWAGHEICCPTCNGAFYVPRPPFIPSPPANARATPPGLRNPKPSSSSFIGKLLVIVAIPVAILTLACGWYFGIHLPAQRRLAAIAAHEEARQQEEVRAAREAKAKQDEAARLAAEAERKETEARQKAEADRLAKLEVTANEQSTNVVSENAAWRNSMEEFTKEIVLISKRSKAFDPVFAMTRIRGYTAFNDSAGENIFVVFQDGFDNEFHGELNKCFVGRVSWSGIVDSVKKDAGKDVYTIEIKLPKQSNWPRDFVFPKVVVLAIPTDRFATVKLPEKGDNFAFRGVFRNEKVGEINMTPITILYGLGPNRYRSVMVINLNDVEPVEQAVVR